MRCPWCHEDNDKVVDSRVADDGAAIRRRRECVGCGQRFTTFERIGELPLMVLKRDGARQPFSREKVVKGVSAACKNRPIGEEQIEQLAASVEEALRAVSPEVTTEQVGLQVLEALSHLDDVAYLRFASVYKGFEDVADFQREVAHLEKTTAPKDHGRR